MKGQQINDATIKKLIDLTTRLKNESEREIRKLSKELDTTKI